jgi:hypothetical protein
MGQSWFEKESGSGNVITEKTVVEAERQIGSHCGYKDLGPGYSGYPIPFGDVLEWKMVLVGQPVSLPGTT